MTLCQRKRSASVVSLCPSQPASGACSGPQLSTAGRSGARESFLYLLQGCSRSRESPATSMGRMPGEKIQERENSELPNCPRMRRRKLRVWSVNKRCILVSLCLCLCATKVVNDSFYPECVLSYPRAPVGASVVSRQRLKTGTQ